MQMYSENIQQITYFQVHRRCKSSLTIVVGRAKINYSKIMLMPYDRFTKRKLRIWLLCADAASCTLLGYYVYLFYII